AAKQQLLPIAYNQQQVADCSAVIAILADTQVASKIDAIFGPAVDAGFLTEEVKASLTAQIQNAYSDENNAKLSAVSNASLAAMQLMLVAKDRGWDTCAIGGFNPKAFVETFEIESRYVPVMLIALGKAAQPGRPSSRLSSDTFASFL
ncbi:MAG: nitroreductase family protein, partial [Bacilli bacterium]